LLDEEEGRGLGKARAGTDLREKPLRLLDGPIIYAAFEVNNRKRYN
jgi:hypothetical protein